jgi:hypothetical protein
MPENKKNVTGDDQSAFAGTNPDMYRDQKPADKQDNPIQDAEAQNVTDGQGRMDGAAAEQARNKANEGKERG